jgi:hypothetical protein
MAEQFNRRTAFMAALDLAKKNPAAKGVREAQNLYSEEYQRLQIEGFGDGRGPLTAAEAAAVVSAAYATDETQFEYARYNRPRIFRGRIAGTLFVFKTYMHSLLWLLGQNKADFLPRYLLVMGMLGGLGGLPFYEDLRDLLRAFAHQMFGKDFNLDREVRKYVLQFFGPNPTVPPDVVLHGLARKGFGIPALVDLMGSAPPRGLTGEHSANVPFPVLDRSRAISMGNVDPFQTGKLLGPTKDVNKAIADSTQQASGAVLGVAFNAYKAFMDGDNSGLKRWERVMPRVLGDASESYRAYSEQRLTQKGGPNSAPTLIPFDPRDTEHMMEVFAIAMGYRPARQQAKWDEALAFNEVKAYYDLKSQGLRQQFWEATQGGIPQEIEKVRSAIVDYNTELPDWAKGKAITADSLTQSMKSRALERAAKESGTPRQKTDIGISREMQRLFPESTVDVRRVR